MVEKSLFRWKETSRTLQFCFVLSVLLDKYFTCQTFCINLIL